MTFLYLAQMKLDENVCFYGFGVDKLTSNNIYI